MNCTACGAPVAIPPAGSGPTPCPRCGAPVAALDPRLEAYLVDANHNGIPDVLERRALAAAAAAPGAYRAPGGATLLEGIPPAPRVPSPRARSLVYGYRGSQGVKLLIGLIFTAVGTILALTLGWGLPLDLALAVAASRTQATVTGTEIVSNVRVNNAHPTRIKYRFKLGGASYDGASSTLDSSMRKLAVGASVPVEYLGAAPDVSRVEGTTVAAMGYVGIVVFVFPAVGLVFAIGAWVSNRREIRAFSRGRPVVARITYKGADMNTRVNGRHPFKVEWEFLVDGRPYKGDFSTMERGELAGLVDGEEVAVLYDPASPSVNTIWVP